MEMCYSMPAVMGSQGGKLMYTVSMSMRVLVRMLRIDDAGSVLERSQRKVNPARAKSISNYMLNNPKGYFLPGIIGVVVHSILPYKASDSLYKQIAKEAEARVQKVYRDNEWSGIEAYHYQELCKKYGLQDNANHYDMERVAYFLGAVGRLICYQPNPDTKSRNNYVHGIELIAELTDWYNKTDDQLKQISIDFIEQGFYDKSALTLALLSSKQGKYQGGEE